MPTPPKDPKRADRRRHERISQDRRGLHEARIIVPREHDALLRACAKLLRNDREFPVALAAMLSPSSDVPVDANAEAVAMSPKKPRKRKETQPAAIGDLFAFAAGDETEKSVDVAAGRSREFHSQ
ncbi:hypothetical protein [Rhodobacter capsulatus]|uniref:hypothetical protein n=1 Tax=Rhodobacter capsulatus TaxID=1061 RepID=UPI00402A18A1